MFQFIFPRDVVHSILYHYQFQAPSAPNKCDGTFEVWACLFIEHLSQFDQTLSIKISRCICPQYFKWSWTVLTAGNDEIEGSNSVGAVCKTWKWKKHPMNPSHTLGSNPGLGYATEQFRVHTDPPFGADGSEDDEDYVIAKRPKGQGAKFRWTASTIRAGTTGGQITPGGTLVPQFDVPSLVAGLGFQNIPFDVEWAIWIDGEDDEVAEILGAEKVQERREFKIGDVNVRAIANGFVDPVAAPNLSLKFENTILAKNVFDSANGFSQTISAA